MVTAYNSFPRMSGDEPMTHSGAAGINTFSPHERG